MIWWNYIRVSIYIYSIMQQRFIIHTLPVNILLKDRYDSKSKIKNINTPILIMHGKMDNIVPQKMGLELFEKANNPKFSYFPENDDHMMEYNDKLLNNIKLFINKI